MKHFILALLVSLVVFVAIDELRSIIERQLDPFRPDTWFFGSNLLFHAILTYFVPYCIAGVVTGWLMRAFRYAPWVVLCLGFAIAPGVNLLFGSLRPFAMGSHVPWWYNIIGWANLYGPPIAALCGAIIVLRLICASTRTASPPVKLGH
jgi:ribose/xylose/arabinose/galactoside ABC-type transport system permease subunit